MRRLRALLVLAVQATRATLLARPPPDARTAATQSPTDVLLSPTDEVGRLPIFVCSYGVCTVYGVRGLSGGMRR